MSKLTIAFVPEWVTSQREKGVNVVRQLEKWIKTQEEITLKATTSSGLMVELQPALREKFLKDLADQMKTVFGESDPWEHTTFSGDLAGLDVPTKKSKAAQAPLPTQERQPPSEEESEPKLGKDTKQDKTEVPPPDPRETVEEICSRVPVKHSRELEAYVRETAAVIPTLQKMGVESSLWHQHLLLAVDAGYGRSEFLVALAQLYKAFGLVKGDVGMKSVCEYILMDKDEERDITKQEDGYRVKWNTVLETAKSMNESNMRHGISKVILYIDVSAWHSSLATTVAKSRLRQLNALCGNFLLVFRVPFLEAPVLRETADALNDILNVRTIAVPPAPIGAMIDYARGELAKSGFQVADTAANAFEQWVLHEKVDNSFFGYKTMDKVVQKLIYEKALSNCRKGSEDQVISTEDLKGPSITEQDDNPAAELKKMVGMGDVIRRLNEVIVQIKAQKKLVAKGKKVKRPAIHMVFTGNPGTGKTTVARILARMMQQEGILSKGHLVEVKGRDLCGQYIGETAPKTSAICRDAYGSVLFIDEAYSLFRDEFSSARDYGREAMDTLVAEMENHRDDFCVIMAGYKDEMDAMLKGNAGLKSRIPYEIEFPNFSRNDLEKIFFSMLTGVFEYEAGLKDVVHKFFAELPDDAFQSKEFSNARLVRNLYERTWGKAAYRQSLEGGELRILKSDLINAMSDSEFDKIMKKKPEHRMGFDA